MAKAEFFARANAFFQLYYEQRYADALSSAEDLAREYPEQDIRTAFWLICLQNLNGHPELALQTLRDALERGLWWAEPLLREDTDLASLQGNGEFEQLVRRSEQMHLQAEAAVKPFVAVHQPAGNGPFPLLLCLGPRRGYPELDFRDWSPVLELGWMLALPRSSQMSSPVAFVWDDREKAMDEVTGLFETLVRDYPIDLNRVVIAGFSQGAARAIELVMSQRIQARGFFAVVPGPLDLSELENWAESGTKRHVLVSGGKDPRYQMFIHIREMFESYSIPLLFEHDPGMAHQIPDNFESVLQRGLDFILKEQE